VLIAASLGQSLLTHEFKEILEEHRAVMQSLDREMFKGLAIHVHYQLLTDSVNLENHKASP
jgi:hypothetical protein